MEIKHIIRDGVDLVVLAMDKERGDTLLVSQWLMYCATNQKVAGSIPDGVFGIFHWQSFRSHYGPRVDSTYNRNE
jgi:hypothetical protein